MRQHCCCRFAAEEKASATAKAKSLYTAVVYGFINGIVGLPTMISFVAIIFKVRRTPPQCCCRCSGLHLAGRASPMHLLPLGHGEVVCRLACNTLAQHVQAALQDPTYTKYLSQLAKLGFFASGVHQAVRLLLEQDD